MKKILSSMIILLIGLVPLIFASCGNDYDNIRIKFEEKISAKDNQYEYVMDSNEDNIFSFDFKVENASNTETNVSSTSDIVTILSVSNVSQDLKRATVKVNKKGQTDIVVKTLEGGKTASFTFKALEYIKELKLKADKSFAIIANQDNIELNASDFLQISPATYDKANFEFAIVNSDDGVTATITNGNKLSVGENPGKFGIKIIDTLKINRGDEEKSQIVYVTVLSNVDITPNTTKLHFYVNDQNSMGGDNTKIITFGGNFSENIKIDFTSVEDVQKVISHTPWHTPLDGTSGKQSSFELSFNKELRAGTTCHSKFTFTYLNENNEPYVLIGRNLPDCNIESIYDAKINHIEVNNGTQKDTNYANAYYFATTLFKSSSLPLKFNITCLPNNVSDQTKEIRLTSQYLDYFKFVVNGNELTKNDGENFLTILSGTTLSVSIKEDLTPEQLSRLLGNIDLVLQSIYSSQTSTGEIPVITARTTIKLNVREGVKQFDFYGIESEGVAKPHSGEGSPVYYLSINQNATSSLNLLYGFTGGDDVTINDFDVLSVTNLKVLSKTIVTHNGQRYLCVKIASKDIGAGSISIRPQGMINAKNVGTKSIRLHDVNDISLRLPSIQENSDIAKNSYSTTGTTFNAAIKVGAKVPFYFTDGIDISNFVCNGADNVYHDELSNISFSINDENGLFDMGEGLVSSDKSSKNTLNLNIFAFGIKDGMPSQTSSKSTRINLTFFYPIQAITLSSATLRNLYSLSSVGFFNSDLSTASTILKVVTADPDNLLQAEVFTLLDNIFNVPNSEETQFAADSIFPGQDYSISVKYGDSEKYTPDNDHLNVIHNNGVLQFIAKQSDVRRVQISLTQYNRTYTVTIKLDIKDAEKVESVAVSNVSEVTETDYVFEIEESIYAASSYQIVASALLATAYNKNLVYEVYDGNKQLVASSHRSVVDTNNYGITIDKNGLLKWGDKGIDGEIVILPEDSFQLGEDGYYSTFANAHKSTIKLLLTDGSKTFPFVVYSADGLKTLLSEDGSLNYYVKLAANINAQNLHITNLNGGIDGNKFAISGLDGTFIETIAEGAELKNITFDFNNSNVSTASICQDNRGTMLNLVLTGAVGGEGNLAILARNNYGQIQKIRSDVNLLSDDILYHVDSNHGRVSDLIYFGRKLKTTLINTNSQRATFDNLLIYIPNDIFYNSNQQKILTGTNTSSTSGVYSFKSNTWEAGEGNGNLPNLPSSSSYVLKSDTDKFFTFQHDGENYIVLYSNTTTQNLSDKEKAKLELLNSVKLQDLIKFTDDGMLNATFEDEYYNFSFTTNSIAKTGNRLMAQTKNNEDFTTLIISHKLISDFEVVLKFFVINPIGSLSIYDGSDKNNREFNENIKVSFKRDISKPVYFDLAGNSKVLSSKVVYFETEEDFEYHSDIDGYELAADGGVFDKANWQAKNNITSLGLRTITFADAGAYEFVPYIEGKNVFDFSNIATNENTLAELNQELADGELTLEQTAEIEEQINNLEGEIELQRILQALNEKIKLKFQRVYNINIYNGAQSIQVSTAEIENTPENYFQFDVEIITDKSYEVGESAITLDFYDSEFDIFDQNAHPFKNNAFISEKSKEDIGNGYSKYIYTISLELKNKFTAQGDTYYIKVYPNEENADKTSLEKEIKITILPQQIRSLELLHYYEDEETSTADIMKISGDVKETLAPGKNGLLKIDFAPYYANVERFEINTSNLDNDFTLSLMPMTYDENNGGYVAEKTNNNYPLTDNGLIIYSKLDRNIDNENVQSKYNPLIYTKRNDAEDITPENVLSAGLYIKTIAPTDILEDMEYEINVKVYLNGQPDQPIEKSIRLVTKFIPRVEIEVDTDIVGRATWNDFKISVTNSTSDMSSGEFVSFLQGDGEGNKLVAWGERDGIIYSISDGYQEVHLGGNSFKRIFSGKFYVGSTFGLSAEDKIGDNKESSFTIKAISKSVINGNVEIQTTNKKITVYDAAIKNVSINNYQSNTYNGYIGVTSTLSFGATFQEPEVYEVNGDNVKDLKEYLQKLSGELTDIEYVISDGANNSISNAGEVSSPLRIIDAQGIAIAEIKVNEDKTFIVKGLARGKCELNLKTTLNNRQEQNFAFFLDIDYYTTEDRPILINSIADFDKYITNNESITASRLDYILMCDLTLDKWRPIPNTAKINSFDGNNKIITITGASDYALSSGRFALFDRVNPNTTLKNVTVDFSVQTLRFSAKDIKVAGLAIENNGIITNCQVLSKFDSKSRGGIEIDVANTQTCTCAGFAITNNGSITNSRVGLTTNQFIQLTQEEEGSRRFTTKRIALSDFNISASGDIAGFVAENTSKISGCYFTGNITNAAALSNTKTAGFALSNSANAKIVGSFVKGTGGVGAAYTLSLGISTSNSSAGFIFDNNGEITDSYAQINLKNSSSTGGFVYSNQEAARIENCFFAGTIKNSNSVSNYFSGISERLEVLNKGTITNCYYVSTQENTFKDGSLRVLTSVLTAKTTDNKFNEKNYKREFLGFNFETRELDGVWICREGFVPDLVSANNISIAIRGKEGRVNEDGTEALMYLEGYEYGSKNNPIIIRTSTEFNNAFSRATDSTSLDFIKNGTTSASYRLVCDIDLSEIESTQSGQLLNTPLITFDGGELDGNGMLISNIDIASYEQAEHYGLFAAAINNTMLKNIRVSIMGVTNTSAKYVGGIVGYLENSTLVCSEVTNSTNTNTEYGEKEIFVRGLNVVGGAVGYVYRNSVLSNINASVNVQAAYVDNSDDIIYYNPTSTNSNIAYAGSIAGIIDIGSNMDDGEKTYVQNLQATGAIKVYGYIVGGISGYIGSRTIAEGLTFVAGSGAQLISQRQTDKAKGFVGGLVGQLRGLISESRFYEENQSEIDSNVSSYYYSNKTSADRKTNQHIFDTGRPSAIGGIAGLVDAVKLSDNLYNISYSYSKCDLINPQATYVGGLVGEVQGTLAASNVYHFGALKGSTAGTGEFVGLNNGIVGIEKANSIVYFDKYNDTNLSYGAIGKNGESAEPPKFVHCFISCSLTATSYETDNLNCEKINIKDLYNSASEIANSHKSNAFTRLTSEKWDKTTILPELSRTSTATEYLIRESALQTDLENILNHSNATFKLIADVGEDNEFIISQAAKHEFDKLGVISFNGVITTEGNQQMTVKLESGFNIINPIFSKLDGGSISNLTFEGIHIQIPAGSKAGTNYSILARTGSNVMLSNVKFKDCSITYEETVEEKRIGNVGIIYSTSSNAMFQNVTLENCTLGTAEDPLQVQKAGFLTASDNGNLRMENLGENEACITDEESKIFVKSIPDSSLSVGLLVGSSTSTSLVTFTSDNNSTAAYNTKAQGSIYVTNGNEKCEAKIGGLFGYAGNVLSVGTTQNLNCTPTIHINQDSKFKTLHLGGIAGLCGTMNIDSGSVKSQLTLQNDDTTSTIIKAKDAAYIGAIYGSIVESKAMQIETGTKLAVTGELKFEGSNLFIGACIGQATSDLVLNLPEEYTVSLDVTSGESDAINNLHAGGVVGYADGKINVSNTETANFGVRVVARGQTGQTYIGGIVGYGKNLTGRLLADENTAQLHIFGDIVVETTYEKAYVGSFAGYLESNNYTINNLATGVNVLAQYGESRGELHAAGIAGYLKGVTTISNCLAYGDIEIWPDDNDVVTTANFLYWGGLVGEAPDKITFDNNYSLATLLNKNFYTNKVGAFIGGNPDKTYEGNGNYYCSQVCLAVETKIKNDTNSGITNLLYKDILGSGHIGQKWAAFAGGDEGTKLNPHKMTTLAPTIVAGENKAYNSFEPTETLEVPAGNFLNMHDGVRIIGNGNSIIVKSEKDLYDTIPSRSIVSGLNIQLNYATELSNQSHFVTTNNGYLFEISIIDANRDNIRSRNLCKTNNGYIGFCQTDVENKLSGSAAFVNTNNGIIESCFSAGSVQDAYSYAFVCDNMGVIANSYTITNCEDYAAKIIGSNTGIIKNFIFDQDCTQSENFGSLAGLCDITNAMPSVDASGYLVWDNENNHKFDFPIWAEDIAINYGYPYPNLYDNASTPTRLISRTAQTYSGATTYNIRSLSQLEKTLNDISGTNSITLKMLYGIDTTKTRTYQNENFDGIAAIQLKATNVALDFSGKTITFGSATNKAVSGLFQEISSSAKANINVVNLTLSSPGGIQCNANTPRLQLGEDDEIIVLGSLFNYINNINLTSNNVNEHHVMDYARIHVAISDAIVGGLIGYAKNSTISNCTNEFDIEIHDDDDISGCIVGGVVGKYSHNNDNASTHLNNLKNMGGLTVVEDSAENENIAGGIIGHYEDKTNYVDEDGYWARNYITACENCGIIRNFKICGGINGKISSNAALNGCISNRQLAYEENTISETPWAGLGFVGYYATITHVSGSLAGIYNGDRSSHFTHIENCQTSLGKESFGLTPDLTLYSDPSEVNLAKYDDVGRSGMGIERRWTIVVDGGEPIILRNDFVLPAETELAAQQEQDFFETYQDKLLQFETVYLD